MIPYDHASRYPERAFWISCSLKLNTSMRASFESRFWCMHMIDMTRGPADWHGYIGSTCLLDRTRIPSPRRVR
jgi:hypothetical protein